MVKIKPALLRYTLSVVLLSAGMCCAQEYMIEPPDSTAKSDIRPLKKNELTAGFCFLMNSQLANVGTNSTYHRFIVLQYTRNILNKNEFSLKGQVSYSLVEDRVVSHISDFLVEIEPSRKWFALTMAMGFELIYQPYRMMPNKVEPYIYPFEEIETLFVLKIGNNIRPFNWFIIKPTIEYRYGRYSIKDSFNKWMPSFGLQAGFYF